jgi:hypothetical protein
MKRSILIATFTAVAFSFATIPALAQHGRPASPGAAAGAMGGTHGDASTHSGSGNSGTNTGAKSGGTLNPNSKLSENLAKLLPAGTTPQQACDGFKNLGQCVAAIHVSHNLGIDFNALKCDMTGKSENPSVSCPATTSSKNLSLGKSIDTLKPGTDSKTESQKATQQAKQDINGSNS